MDFRRPAPLPIRASYSSVDKVVAKRLLPSGDVLKRRAELNRLEDLVKSRTDIIKDLQERLSAQRKENEFLEKLVSDMKELLSDYNIKWSACPDVAYPHGPMLMEIFLSRIERLNQLAGSDVPTAYIYLQDKRFWVGKTLRDYHDRSSVVFFQDIYEGFFPGEFRQAYPKGLRLEVDDRRHVYAPQARGEGILLVRVPDGSEVRVSMAERTTIGEICDDLAVLALPAFDLILPPSAVPLERDAIVSQITTWPRGMLVVKPR